MADLPSFEQLDAIRREVLNGLLEERAGPAWAATYQHRWQRPAETWKATQQALASAASGDLPSRPIAKPPPWLARVIDEQLKLLSRRWSQRAGFQPVRLVERLGLVTLQHDDTYVLAMVSGLGDRRDRNIRTQALRSDRDLVGTALWRVFEIEGGGEISLANVDKYSAPAAGWKQTFVDLVADGTLPRSDVLARSLDALGRDFSAYRAQWFTALYDALEPTIAEQSHQQPELRNLIRSSVGPTASMAVARLKALEAAGVLNEAATVPALGVALEGKTKTTALDALVILDKIASRANLATEVAAVAVLGLQHQSADVQKKSIALLQRLEASDAVADRADDLKPSARRTAGLQAQTAEPGSPKVPRTQARPDRLPQTKPDRNAVEMFAALLEDASDPLLIEQALAAHATSPDLSVLAPLRKRSRQILERGAPEGMTPGWLRGHIARLILMSLRESVESLPQARETAFLVARIEELVSSRPALSAGPALLATPDRDDVWLSPATFLDRLDTTDTPRHHDLVAALLRLHPDGRTDEARHRAASIPGELGLVASYALGGPPPVRSGRVRRRSQVVTPAWWVAASRTRGPVSDDELLVDHGLAGSGQGRPVEGSVEATPQEHQWTDRSGKRHRITHWRWAVEVAHPVRQVAVDQPTAVQNWQRRAWATSLGDWVPWLAIIWPHDGESFMVDGCDPVLDAIAEGEVRHDATHVLDALLAHPGRLGPLTATAVAAGLGAKRAENRVRSVDLALEVVPGRLSPAALAEAMTVVAGAVPLGRWATSLTEVAATSDAASSLVIDVLASLLPTLDYQHRALRELIDVLHEELLRQGRTASDPALATWIATGIASTGTTAMGRLLRALQSA